MQIQSVVTLQKRFITDTGQQTVTDTVAVEEPLEIVVQHLQQQRSLGITMRTPGEDRLLTLGLLFSQGLIQRKQEVAAIEEEAPNRVRVLLRKSIAAMPAFRAPYRSAACGICGSEVIAQILHGRSSTLPTAIRIAKSDIHTAFQIAATHQTLFARTGGTHAASLFTADAEHIATFEDVGRHNAVDKAIGYLVDSGDVPGAAAMLILSGRAGFELVHKAVRAGIGVVCAIGAPSSLAVHLAREAGILLVAFYRSSSFSVYAGEDKLHG